MFSENFYEGKFGISGGLEETWGGGEEKFSVVGVLLFVFFGPSVWCLCCIVF
jgi:hypothetical protein